MFNAHKKKDREEMKIQQITLQTAFITVASNQPPIRAGMFPSIQTEVLGQDVSRKES